MSKPNAVTDQVEQEAKLGQLTLAGALTGAILASACCWLPLVLIGLGASTLGIASLFEVYRPHLLVVTAAFLGVSFYYVYLRKPKCSPGQSCALPDPRRRRINQLSLWATTALAVIFGTFPLYVGKLQGSDDSGSATSAAQTPETLRRVYTIEGMTCEGCAGGLRKSLIKLDGVIAVEVSYPKATATIVFDPGAANDAAILRAIEDAGYQGQPASSSPQARDEEDLIDSPLSQKGTQGSREAYIKPKHEQRSAHDLRPHRIRSKLSSPCGDGRGLR